MYILEERSIIVERPYRDREVQEYASVEEARVKLAFLEELHEWIGTPFRDCAAIKGKATDCASYQWAAAMKVGLIKDVGKPKYHPRHLVHRDEQRYVEFLHSLGAREVETPRLADIHVYWIGRVFGHGAVRINSEQVIHAYGPGGCVCITRIDSDPLKFIPRTKNLPRPVRYFDVWNR